MPLAVQLVQAAVFTPDQATPYDFFVTAFGMPPTQLQPATPPMSGVVALSQADARNLVLQASPGRIDLFATSVEQYGDGAVPGQFTPIVDPDGAVDLVVAAASRLAATRTTVNRVDLAIRHAEKVEGAAQASTLFSQVTGIPAERVGTSDNVFQTNSPKPMESLPGAVLSQVRRCQTEMVVVFISPVFTSVPTASPMALDRREHHGVSLNVDIGIIPQSGTIPVDMVSSLLHQVREIAVGLAQPAVSGRAAS